MLRFFLLLGPFVLILSCCDESPECLQTRGAFDVGSGSTKMSVAQVDVCERKIVKVLHSESQKVPFQTDLREGSEFSVGIQNQGVQTVLAMKRRAQEYGRLRWVGVATAAFRRALNGQSFIQRLSLSSGIPFQIISQQEEAALGYLGGLAAVPAKKAVVWDVGGGSQQMVMAGEDGMLIYRGQIASESFKQQIIEKVQRRSAHSPNPLTLEHAAEARKLLPVMTKEMPEPLLRAFQDPETVVIGIGRVHASSIASQVKKDSYTRQDLEGLVDKKLGMEDRQFGGQFQSNCVSNLILISSIMEQLGISRVHIAPVDLTYGIFVSPDYWP